MFLSKRNMATHSHPENQKICTLPSTAAHLSKRKKQFKSRQCTSFLSKKTGADIIWVQFFTSNQTRLFLGLCDLERPLKTFNSITLSTINSKPLILTSLPKLTHIRRGRWWGQVANPRRRH